MIGVYVHIPFCAKKCDYCDFVSFDNKNDLKKPYVKALIEEINGYVGDCDADTVFFGGGTPTSLDIEDLVSVVNAVNQKFRLKNCEFTVEANPATIGRTGLLLLRNSGVNRISFGLQSCNDDELSALGRIHTFNQFLNTYNDARNAGFENLNIDIMFGIPGQTIDSFKNTLNTVVRLSPSHISCYSLIIEEGTPFYTRKLDLPDEETEREMYYYALAFLEKNGYNRYEISNFSKNNRNCRHNIKYWTRQNYVGFGASACSLINNVRYKNSIDICSYINNNIAETESVGREDAMAEHIFLGLRLAEGFDISEFEQIYNVDFKKKYKHVLDKYVKTGYLTAQNRLKLTDKGISVSNIIMSEFL